MKKLLPFLSLLALPLAFSPSARANLIANGGFETGTSAGWTLVPADAGSYCVITPTMQNFGYTAQEGLYAVGFGAMGDSLDTIYQSFSTVAGEYYNFSFWLHNNAGWSGSTLLASWGSTYLDGYNSKILPITNNVESFDWLEYNFLKMATSTQTTIAFSGLSNSDWIMVDNVTVTPKDRVQSVPRLAVSVPDTASTAFLLAIGFVAVAGLRRARVVACPAV